MMEVAQDTGWDQALQRLCIKELLEITANNVIGPVNVEEYPQTTAFNTD